MARVLLESNYEFIPQTFHTGLEHAKVTFSPMLIGGSISLAYVNWAHRISISASADASYTVSLGLYSLSGSTLSLHQSTSGSKSYASAGANRNSNLYLTCSFTSTNDITPGTWWWGAGISLTGSVVGSNSLHAYGESKAGQNSIPNAFYAGALTETTNALPSSYATSNLDNVGIQASAQYILISS